MACGSNIWYYLETSRVQTAVLRIKCQPLSDESGWLSSPICSARVPCNELMYSGSHNSVLPGTMPQLRSLWRCWGRFSDHLIKGGLHLAGSERPQIATSLSRTAGEYNHIKSCSVSGQSALHAISPHIQHLWATQNFVGSSHEHARTEIPLIRSLDNWARCTRLSTCKGTCNGFPCWRALQNFLQAAERQMTMT